MPVNSLSQNILEHTRLSPISQHLSPPQIRRIVLDQSKRAHMGHLGSALSVADVRAALYARVCEYAGMRATTQCKMQKDKTFDRMKGLKKFALSPPVCYNSYSVGRRVSVARAPEV